MGRIEWFRTHHYRANLTSTQDQELLLRAYSASRFACLTEVLLGYREESLSVRKILRGRRNFCGVLIRTFVPQGKYRWASRGILGQAVKGIVDLFAVAFGLDYHVLRHRAESPTDEMLVRWDAVWAQVQTRHFREDSTTSCVESPGF